MTYRHKVTLAKQTVRYLLLAFAFVFFAFPFYWIVCTSLKPVNQTFRFPPQFLPIPVTLGNYAHVIVVSKIANYIANTLIVSCSSVALLVACSCFAAFSLSRHRFRRKNVIMLLILATQMLPASTNIIPVYLMMKSLGLLDKRIGLVFLFCAFSLPFSVWIMKGFIDQIPRSLDESAKIDGCSDLQIFIRIVGPLSLPAIGTILVFGLVQCWSNFIMPLILIDSNSKMMANVAIYLYKTSYGTDWASITSAAFLIVTPLFIVFLALQRFFIRGLLQGAIKG